jgi:hypothetical protein
MIRLSLRRVLCSILLLLAATITNITAQAAGDLKYHSYDSMLAELRLCEKNHPDICQLHDLGASSDGKTRMWAMKISDNVRKEEDEPNVLLTGAIHGNERPTVEMALFTIGQLLGNSKKHAKLIANTQIWVIPMMNTAGHARDSRMNANRVDLNRGFPTDYRSPSLKGCQPETVNLITNFFRKHNHVVAGIDLHTYGRIYLSSWACSRNDPADWAAMSDLGNKMAKASGYRFMPLNRFIRRTVKGGGADYRYGAHGTFYYGLELGRSHNPPASSLRRLFERNLKSVLMMMNRVHHSTLTGHVTNRGKPAQVTITVEGIDTPKTIRAPYRSDKKFGRYYRLLLPGKYTVTYTPDKGEPVKKTVTIVRDAQTTVDIELSEST